MSIQEKQLLVQKSALRDEKTQNTYLNIVVEECRMCLTKMVQLVGHIRLASIKCAQVKSNRQNSPSPTLTEQKRIPRTKVPLNDTNSRFRKVSVASSTSAMISFAKTDRAGSCPPAAHSAMHDSLGTERSGSSMSIVEPRDVLAEQTFDRFFPDNPMKFTDLKKTEMTEVLRMMESQLDKVIVDIV